MPARSLTRGDAAKARRAFRQPGSRICQWDNDVELAAATDVARYRDAPHGRDELIDDRQPQPGTAMTAHAGSVDLGERGKYSILIGLRNTDAGITDGES